MTATPLDRTHTPSIVVIPPSIQPFWNKFTASLGHDPSDRFNEAFHFDDNAPSADELAALVLAGRKRATAALLWAYESEGKPLPKPGDLSVVTLFSGEPVCVIETRDIKIVPFSEVDEDFAATEGEGDGSLAYWQRAHTAGRRDGDAWAAGTLGSSGRWFRPTRPNTAFPKMPAPPARTLTSAVEPPGPAMGRTEPWRTRARVDVRAAGSAALHRRATH